MTIFLQPYLTEFDDSLSGDSYIDPIGTLVIWSAFGRQVFSNRINSISNDVRNYTLNLLHHHLVRQLVLDDSVVLSRSLQRQYQGKDKLPFKQACLIFLENLFVYSMLRHGDDDGMEAGGILGISKARRSWENDEGNPTLRFTHGVGGQILVRQLGLGVSGRYKSPLMNIGFFDTNYHYNNPGFAPRWAAAEQFIAGGGNALLAAVCNSAYAFLKHCVATLNHGAKLGFKDDVPDALALDYARAFASPALVGSYARDFWLEQTGLASGSAGALLKALESGPADELEPQALLTQALLQPLSPEDRAKLQEIRQLEPFLSDCALLFNLMAAERSHTVADVAAHWQRFGRDASRLGDLAQDVAAHASLPAVRGSTAAQRLVQLQRVAGAGSLEDQIRQLSTYHAQVMRARGQVAWLSVEADGKIKVNARTVPRPEPEAWPPGAWHNNYYLPQFKSFVSGLQGVSA